MTDTLEIVDLEQMLSDELGCAVCNNPAEYLTRMPCCNDRYTLCGGCVERARKNFAEHAPLKVKCGVCHVVFGWRHSFDEVVTVVPI